MAVPTFLTILPEIRELIYTIYLTTPNPLEPEQITRENRLPPKMFAWFDEAVPGWPSELDSSCQIFMLEGCNSYPDPTKNPVRPASLALLLCNRQINIEVTSVIAFLTAHTKRLLYEIDCEIVDEVMLYPTWLHIPIVYKDVPIPCLYATFRISGKLEINTRSGWEPGSGGPGPMVWSLLALLNRFLSVGPNFIGFKGARPSTITDSPIQTSSTKGNIKALGRRIFKSGRVAFTRTPENPECPSPQKQKETIIKIKKLVLDFAPPALAREGLDARRPTTHHDGEMVDPMEVANLLTRKLEDLFCGSPSTLRFGNFIASRVDSVHLRCYGEDLAEWDLEGSEIFSTKTNK